MLFEIDLGVVYLKIVHLNGGKIFVVAVVVVTFVVVVVVVAVIEIVRVVDFVELMVVFKFFSLAIAAAVVIGHVI